MLFQKYSSKKICKKIIVITLLNLLIMLLLIPYSLAVNPTRDFYVNDYAQILSNETEKHIIEKNVSLAAQTGAQIVVVTVPNLEGRDLESYATDLFRRFGIGDKKENNGLLLLLALEEREFRVEVGYGLEGILPDGKTGRMQDEYIIPYLKNNEWDKGVLNGFNAFLKEVCDYYQIDSDVLVETPTQTIEVMLIMPIIITIVIFILLLCFKPTRHIMFWLLLSGGGHGRGGGGFRRRTAAFPVVEVLLGGGGSSRGF